MKVDGSVVTWGNMQFGGDSSGAAGDLSKDVQTVVGSERAFAAVKPDGSVVLWGLMHCQPEQLPTLIKKPKTGLKVRTLTINRNGNQRGIHDPEGDGRELSANFERLVLGCIDANFCKKILNSFWKALDEIYNIYILLYRSDFTTF